MSFFRVFVMRFFRTIDRVTPALAENTWATILYWALMAPIAAAILHVVAGYLADDYPTSFLRGLFLVLVTAASVFFAFDITAYLFALMMRDPSVGITFPPGFSYWDWLREPLALKWRILGLVPFIRFIPLFIALIVGCLVQVFVWKVEFKIGAVVFVAQAVLTVAAMVALSFVFRFGIAYYEHFIPPRHEQAVQTRPPRGQDRNAPPSDLEELALRCQERKGQGDSVWHRIGQAWGSFNGHLAPMYGALEPVTRHLPHPVQDLLNAGGWLVVFAGLLGLIFFGPHFHRNRKEILRPKSKRSRPMSQIVLATIGDSVSGLGAKQAAVRGVPARLRLVVMVPDAAATGKDAVPAPVDQFLEAIRPGLTALTAADYPRVEVWNDPSARKYFRRSCEERVQFPTAAGEPSHWTLLLGQTTWHGKPTQVALGFLLSKPADERLIDVASGQWTSAVGSRDVPAEERD